MREKNNHKTTNILNSSSNLLGFCFIVLTSIKFLKIAEETFIDELTACAFVIFMLSSLLAFLSMRSESRRSILYETIAEYAFLVGLILIFVTALLITLTIIH